MKHGVLELSCMTTLEEAIEVYGEDLQKQMAIEEMAELTKKFVKILEEKTIENKLLRKLLMFT